MNPATTMTSDAQRYDAVVVGSGIGGLAAASLLARIGGKRVLVLERHFKAGGFTHVFQRQRWSFDVGVHYVGEMGPGETTRRLFDLASGGALRWTKMPSPYDCFHYPGLRFDVPVGERAYREALAAAFPAERGGIDGWFEEVRAATRWTRRHFVGLLLPDLVAGLYAWPGRRAALRTTAEVTSRLFRDPLLRAVVTSQWATYGLPPSQSAFAMHALIVRHYRNGGWYPEGGSGAIPATFLAQVERAGGTCLVNHEVEEILVEGGRAVGVRALAHHAGRVERVNFRAPLVISDVGLSATYRLAGRPDPLPRAMQRDGISAVTLYLGLKESPAALGFRGENHYVFETADHDAAFARRNDVVKGQVPGLYLSFPSLKDPAARTHTAEILAMADAAPFVAWRDGRWRRRGGAYAAMKATISAALLDAVERRFPGFRDLVAFEELSTPLSVEHFTAHPGGRIYGVPPTPERFRTRAFGVRTPVEGLLLAGADAGSLGVTGAFMGGALAAGAALGRSGIGRIFAAAREAPGADKPRAAA